jgi:hypothetical protein
MGWFKWRWKYTAGRSLRALTFVKHLLALIAAIHDQIVQRGFFQESELAALTNALERHLDASDTLVTRPLLFQAWGRKPT